MLLANKQEMYYASKSEESLPVYRTDSDGNIIYTTIDGEQIPLETGDYHDACSTPIKFEGNISNEISEVLLASFGAYADNSVQLMMDKDEIDLEIGDYIWKQSAIGTYADGTVNPETSDYTVAGIADDGLSVSLYLLKRNVK